MAENNPPPNFTTTQLKEIRECFDIFDTDNSGSIDKNEIKSILSKLEINCPEEEFDKIFDKIDANKSGFIEWEEFLDLMSVEYHKKFTPKQLADCFKRYDLNSDNVVTINEIRTVLEKIGKTMTQKQLEDMLKTVDKDHTGNFSLDEFEKLLP